MNNQAFMGINIVELINKHTKDQFFLRNGCAKELVEKTGIDIDDAFAIIDQVKSYKEPAKHSDIEGHGNATQKLVDAILEEHKDSKGEAIKAIREEFELGFMEASAVVDGQMNIKDALFKSAIKATNVTTKKYSSPTTVTPKPLPTKKSKGGCPACGSDQVVLIDNNPGGTKVQLNLNPLEPLTPLKTKKKKKKVRSTSKTVAALFTLGMSTVVTGGTKTKVSTEWKCLSCGKKYYKK